MKTFVSPSRQTYLNSGSRTDADFYRIVRKDGTTIGFSSHVKDLTIGGVLYKAGAGFSSSAFGGNIQLNPSVIDLEGILSVLGIPRTDIEAGLYDHADFYAFTTNYLDPYADDDKRGRFKFGDVRLERNRFVAELVGLGDAFNSTIGETYQVNCPALFGGTRCKVPVDPSAWQASTAYTERPAGEAGLGSTVKPTSENGLYAICTVAGTSGGSEPTWPSLGNTVTDGGVTWLMIRAYKLTGSVTGVTDRSNFTDSTKTQPNDWWTKGVAEFASGLNSGLSFDVKKSLATGAITLFDSTPYDIQTGDNFTITAGCMKRKVEDCINKYDNQYNNRGFDRIPTIKEVTKIGGQ